MPAVLLALAPALALLVSDRALGAAGSSLGHLATPDQPAHLDDASQDRIAALSSLLFDLDAAELDVAAATYRRTKPLELVLAIIDRAGRPVPPGLSRARTTQRKVRSEEARDWIAREIEYESGAVTVTDALDMALSREPGDPTAVARGISAELTAAAMGVVSALDLAAHAPAVSGWLTDDTSPALRAAARTNLFRMYGRWFETTAEFEAAWPALRGREPAETGRDELLAIHEVANERALALIEFAPEQLGRDLVTWRDPSMAARAARAVGRAVASDRLKPDAARALLVKDIATERRPAVLHARLETLLDLIQGADPSSAAAAEVRDVVAGLAAGFAERGFDGQVAGAAWTVMAGLPRLPHAAGPEGDDARVQTLDLGVRMFSRVLEGADVRAFDPDGLQGAITALVDLARSIENEATRKAASRPLADLVRPFVLNSAAAPTRVRRASAVAFGLSVQPDDASDLVQLVSQMKTPEIEYELLGVLKASIAVLEPGSKGSEDVVEALFQSAAEPDFDTRKRALELLLGDDVRRALGAVERKTRARWLASSLLAETAPELRVKRLALLERIGDRDALALLVGADESGTTDGSAIEELAASGEEVTEALARATVSLARDDWRLRMAIGRQLVGPDSVDRMTDPLAVVRRRAGLRVALVGEAEVALSLPAEDHRWIVGVALEIRHAAPALARELFTDVAFSQRLDLHRQSLTALADPLDAPSTSTLAALLGADRLRPQGPIELTADARREAEIDRVSDLFEGSAAQIAALSGPRHGWTEADLRLEAVAFLRSIGRFEEAVAAMDRLFDEGVIEAASLPGSTLRTFAELIESQPVSTEAQLERALSLRLEGIARSEWASEDAGLRLGDLESAVSLAAKARSDETRTRVTTLLRSLLRSEEGSPTPTRTELEAYDKDRIQAVLANLDAMDSDAGGEPEDVDDAEPDGSAGGSGGG